MRGGDDIKGRAHSSSGSGGAAFVHERGADKM